MRVIAIMFWKRCTLVYAPPYLAPFSFTLIKNNFGRSYRFRGGDVDSYPQEQGKAFVQLTELFTKDGGDHKRVLREREARLLRLESV